MLFLQSVAAQVAWAWLAFYLTASPVWCSAARPLLWPVPLGNLAGVSRTNPAFQCQVRPREGGRSSCGENPSFALKTMLGADTGGTGLLLGAVSGTGQSDLTTLTGDWTSTPSSCIFFLVLCDQVILFLFLKPHYPRLIGHVDFVQ